MKINVLKELEALTSEFPVLHLFQGKGEYQLQVLNDTGAKVTYLFRGSDLRDVIHSTYIYLIIEGSR